MSQKGESEKDSSNEGVLNYVSGIYSCETCCLKIAAESEFRKHLETHPYDCLYRCLHCPALSASTSAVTDHIGIEHPEEERYYGCMLSPTTDQIIKVLNSKGNSGSMKKKSDAHIESRTFVKSTIVETEMRKDTHDVRSEKPSDKELSSNAAVTDGMDNTSTEPGRLQKEHVAFDDEEFIEKEILKYDDLLTSQDPVSDHENQHHNEQTELEDFTTDPTPSLSLCTDEELPPKIDCQQIESDKKRVSAKDTANDSATQDSNQEARSEDEEIQSDQDRLLDRRKEDTAEDQDEKTDSIVNVQTASPRQKLEDTHLPASPIQLTDNDSDIEITGESKVPAEKEKQKSRSHEPSTSKKDSFKTSLQCVYRKGQYVCKSCSGASKSYIQFAKHVYKHLHGSSNRIGHDCPYCPKEKCIVSQPLSCTLVTQLMGILQKQKKAQELATIVSPARPGPFSFFKKENTTTESATGQPGVDYSNAKSQPSTSTIEDDCRGSPIIIEPSTDSEFVTKPIVIEPSDASPEIAAPDLADRRPALLRRRGSWKSQDSGPVESPAGSGTSASSTDNKSYLGAAVNAEYATAGENRSMPGASAENNKDTNKSYSKVSHRLNKTSVVKCHHKDSMFVCERCKYSTQDTKPKLFRKHLWFEVHPTKTCRHCPESVKYNRFMACPVINNIMASLLEAKAKKDAEEDEHEDLLEDLEEEEDQGHHPMITSYPEMPNLTPKHPLIADRDTEEFAESEDSEGSLVLDVVAEDGGTSFMQQRLQNYARSKGEKNLSENQESKSSSGTNETLPSVNNQENASTSDRKVNKIPESNFKDVIAMIQGLNDPADVSKQSEIENDVEEGDSRRGKTATDEVNCDQSSIPAAEEDMSDLDKESGSNTENLSSGMFVISSVVSQATDVHSDDAESSDRSPATTEQPKSDIEANTSSSRETEKLKDHVTSVQKNDDEKEKSNEAADGCGPDHNSTDEDNTYPTIKGTNVQIKSTALGNVVVKDSEQDLQKGGIFTYDQTKVSRQWPYRWSTSRVVHHPSIQQPVTQTRSTYVCAFYKCFCWSSHEYSSFKIHNRLHHPEANNFACALCVRTFASDDYLIQHVDNTHTESSLFINFRHYHCGFKDCSAVFERAPDFLSHVSMAHKNTLSHPCSFCAKEFKTMDELIEHIQKSVTYTTKLNNNLRKSTYKEMYDYVSRSIKSRPEPIDSFIQLHLTCATSTVKGKSMYVTINRCVDNRHMPLLQAPMEQETFKCTNCSLVTSDEDYFEAHVAYCQKHPLLRPKQPEMHTPTKPDDNSHMPEELHGTDESPEMHVLTKSTDERPVAVSDDNDSLPDLEPPVLQPLSPPPAPRRKGVLQSLGKGSPVTCEKCSFSTEFRVVKAIHERVHMYGQDKSKMLWCPHCPYSTDVVLQLKIHVQGHTEKSRMRLYNCGHCSLMSNQVDVLEDHHEDEHGDLELKSEVTRLVTDDLPCPECTTTVKTEIVLLEHLEKEHSHSCVQKYLKDMYLIASLQIVDEDEDLDDSKESTPRKPPKLTPDNKPIVPRVTEAEEDNQVGSDRFQCPGCSYSCYKCGTWVRHMQRHSTAINREIILYCCKTCKWKSTSKRKTIDHCKLRHNEIILEVQTMELSTLGGAPAMAEASEDGVEEQQDPQSENVGISRYHCDFCDFSTNQKSVLVEHWTKHEGQTASNVLDYEVEEQEDFEEDKQAYLTFSGDQQFGKKGNNFNYNDENLRLIEDMFLQLQDDERRPFKQPIRCPICPYSTDLRKCMRRHLVFHKKQAHIKNGYKCSYCPYLSEIEGVVTRHINKHHPDLPVKKISIGRPKMREEASLAGPSHIRSTTHADNIYDREDKVFKTPQKCPICVYTTKLKYNLVQHMKIHKSSSLEETNTTEEGEEDENTSGFTISAVVGSDGSTDMVVREGGRVTKHSKKTDGDDRNDSEEYCQSLFCSKVDGKDLYKCRKCVFMDKDPGKVYHHFCSRHKDYCPFQCGYCAYRSVAVIKIQQHCRINHSSLPTKVCPVQNAIHPESLASPDSGNKTVTADLIEDESTLDDESREQAYDDWLSTFMIKCGNNVQMCNICGYEQKGTAALKRHVLAVHLRYYPYRCKHCAFSAVEANKILKHTDKSHPNLDRKIIRRKIPDDLSVTAENEKDAAKEGQSSSFQKPEDDLQSMLNIKIKEEPCSSPENDDGNEGPSDYEHPSGYSTPEGSSYNLESIQIKKEPEDDQTDTLMPVKLSRRQKYPKQYTKTYRCTECSYLSKWNLADVKHHVLTVHLKIHPYSCNYCPFGSPKRAKLVEHYAELHPGVTADPDEAREEVQSALSIVEQGDDVFIGLGENASEIEKKFLPNVKPRTPKAPGSNQGGRNHSSPAPVPSSPSDYSSASSITPSKAKRASLSGSGKSGTHEQPLDLSFRVTPTSSRSTLVPGRNTQVLKVPTTLRVPTIPKAYPLMQEYSPSPSPPMRTKKKSKKKDYTLYKCSSCGRGYVQKIKAQYHFALKHLNLHPYICNYCSYGESARKRVVDHITIEHPEKEVVVFPAFREHALVQEKVYPVKVDISEYEGAMRAVKFINDSGMLHMKEKSEKCSVRCSQCSILLPSMDSLDCHMASSHRDYTGFKCCYCGVYVKAKQKMRYHLSHKHPRFQPKYQPIKQGSPYGNPLSTFDEIVRMKPQFLGQQRKPASSSSGGGLKVAFPFYRPKQEKIGFANISKKRLSARCSRGYRENTGNLVEDITLQMRVPTQPTPEEVTVEGRPPPKMIKPRSDVVGGTVWLLCNHCQYTTLTSTLMRHHVMSHINYRPFRCSYCSFNGVRSHQVKKHMVSMHRKLAPLVKYRTDPEIESSLTDHFTMKVRRGNVGENQGKPFWPKSGASSSLVSPVVNSKVNARKSPMMNPLPAKKQRLERPAFEDQGEDTCEDDGAQEGGIGTRRPEVYICVLCNFRRPSRSSLLRHIMWELDYRPWSCPHCEYKDVTLFGVKRHCFQTHPRQPFKMILKQNPERMSKILELVEQSKVQTGPEKVMPSATVVKQEPLEGNEKNSGLGYSYNSQPGSSHAENVYEAGMMMAVPSDNTVVTSAEQLEAQEEQHARDPHIYKCKHCSFQSPDKTCFKKHILRHGPKRFQCGYCSYCAVFKAELHKHMSRLHKRKPYKIINLADNQVVTTKVKTKAMTLPIVRPDLATLGGVPKITSTGHSVDAKAEGGLLAQLEAELREMKSGDDYGSDDAPDPATTPNKSPAKRKTKEEGGTPDAAFAVLDGVVLTEEHLSMNALGEYQCQFCDMTSTYREKARTHLAKHFQFRWQCGHCDLKHQLSYEMRRHIRHRHPGYPIRMLRLETNDDFVPKPNRSELLKDKVPVTPIKRPAPVYSRPGPACSKRQKPNPGNVPSVFCCFLCTFKTNSTLELVEHQKMHAESEKMPKLSPEGLVAETMDSSSVASEPGSPLKRNAGSVTSESSEDVDSGRHVPAFVRPFKCGYCDFSGFVRAKVKKHCLRIHKDKLPQVVDQRWTPVVMPPSLAGPAAAVEAAPSEGDQVTGQHTAPPDLSIAGLSVVTDDVLNMPQPSLEHLLKVNNLKGIRW